MKDQSKTYLHEAADTLEKVRSEFTTVNSMNASLCERAFTSGVEMTIKAYEYEKTDKITHTHAIVNIAQNCGLWNLLPKDLQRGIQEWAPFDPNVRYPDSKPYQLLVNSTTPAQFDEMTKSALELHMFVSSLLK